VGSASLAAWLDRVVARLIGLGGPCRAGLPCRAGPTPMGHSCQATGHCYRVVPFPARWAWGVTRARPNMGFVLAWPTNIRSRLCSCRAKNVVLWARPLSMARMARHIYASSFICKQLYEHVWCEPDMQVTSYAINCMNTCGVNQLYRHGGRRLAAPPSSSPNLNHSTLMSKMVQMVI
jgi:hypothetical protein